MNFICNVIWFILGGLITAISWWLLGAIFCITIIGIPLGKQCFKMAKLTLAPFGKRIEYGGGAPSFIANLIWAILAGIPMAIEYVVAGLACCITIIGIPVGIQSFKMAKLAFLPFGAEVVED